MLVVVYKFVGRRLFLLLFLEKLSGILEHPGVVQFGKPGLELADHVPGSSLDRTEHFELGWIEWYIVHFICGDNIKTHTPSPCGNKEYEHIGVVVEFIDNSGTFLLVTKLKDVCIRSSKSIDPSRLA